MSDELPPELARRFTGVQELGSGAFGRVVKAQDSVLGRPVALKILNSFRTQDAEARARFEREAALFSRLASPYLPRVYDFGVVDGTPHIVFELLQGETLAKRLQANGGRLPPPAVERLVEQLLEALQVLHGAQILHRDLKPDNVLLLEDGGLALIDLGLGLALDSEALTRTGVAIGTPAYLAPDLIMGGRWSEASDLYALALIGLQARWGRLPLAGPTLLETLEIRKAGPARWLKSEGLTADSPWVRAMLEALAADPAKRPASVRALRARLLAAAADPLPQESVTVALSTPRPQGRPEPGRGSRRRLPSHLARGLALLVLLAGVGSFGWAWLATRAESGLDRGAFELALGRFRIALDEDPTILEALVMTGDVPSSKALSLWHKGRAAYRRLVDQRELRDTLSKVEPGWLDRSAVGHLGRILLVETLLGQASRRNVPSLFEGEAPSGVESCLAMAVTLVDVPELAGGQDTTHPGGRERVESELSRGGATWIQVFEDRARKEPHSLLVTQQSRMRTSDPHGRPHRGWFKGESEQLVFGLSQLSEESFERYPYQLEFELPPLAGDLVMAFDTQDLVRDRPGWIEVLGDDGELGLPLIPGLPPPADLLPGQEPHQLFLVRLPGSLLPRRPRSLRFRGIGLQPIGHPNPLFGFWHLWIQTSGLLPAALAQR